MMKLDPSGFWYRFVGGLAGAAMISMGVAPMLGHGDVSYTNWFGGLVFAPVAILFGIFTIFCAIFKPKWLAPSAANRLRKRH